MNDQPQNRRELCRTALRWLALGGVATLSAGLIGKSAAPGCAQSASCRNCAALTDCGLPQATETRNRQRS